MPESFLTHLLRFESWVQVKDRAHEVKGKIKEVAADLAGNEKLKLNGKAKVGDITQELKDDFFLDFRR